LQSAEPKASQGRGLRSLWAQLAPGIVALGWVSFFLDVGAEMVYPLVPLYVTHVLHAPGLALGWIEGTAEAMLATVTAWSGRRSDVTQRRVPWIRWGYGIAVTAKPLLALAVTWPLVLALRAADRFGKGLRTAARDALIADLAGPERRGAAFGFHRAMDTAGALSGVLLGMAAIHWMPGRYRTVFALTAIPGAIALWLTFRIREPEKRSSSEVPATPARRLPPETWRVLALLWLFALGNSSDAFLLLRASERGFSDPSVMTGYAVMTACSALIAFPAGRWSDRFGRTRVLACGWTLYAASYAMFAFDGRMQLWPAFAIYGTCQGITQGVAKAWVADHVPADLRGTALGAHGLGLGIAALLSSVAAGALYDSIGPWSPFALGAAVAAGALALLPWLAPASKAV
jgi:MFS family permease